ncbi:MAG: peptidoglycan DD-metalloendopeptidase family protein [Rhodobacteraceae bacterium]|nr:peptidoglycan DD-metalloendopeptidase family protein [Paracoccaceae bacterium]
MRWLALVFAVGFAPLARAESDPAEIVRVAAAEIETATVLLIEARNATNRAQSLARAIRSLEDGLTALRVALRSSTAQENSVREDFASKAADLAGLLSALQTIEHSSSPLAMLHPEGAAAAARAAMIIVAITPELENQAAVLQRDMMALVGFNQLHKAVETNLRSALADLQLARVELNAAEAERRQAPADLLSDAGQLDMLLQAADDLNFLAGEIGKLPINQAAQAPAGFASLKGSLPAPVTGLLVSKFGERNDGGQIQPGISIQAPALSLVSAPNAANVRFAGDFLNYGNMVILEPAAGYLQILAGFGQIYVVEGEVLAAGDAIGLLKGQVPAADEFLIEMSSDATVNSFETLYIELRVDGKPEDPLMWFTGIAE